MPLNEFYAELVKTQQVLNMKHLGWESLKGTAHIDARNLYVHQPRGRGSRALDDSTERFVDETRAGSA